MPAPPEITTEDIIAAPPPGFGIPAGFSFSPDGAHLTYLFDPDGGLTQKLFCDGRVLVEAEAEDPEPLSLEQRLVRERKRERSQGVTSYIWAEDVPRLLVPLDGGLSVVEPDGSRLSVLEAGTDAYLEPRISPDATQIAFVQAGDLWVVDVDGDADAGAAPRRLTKRSEDGLCYGLAEYCAQEELGRRHGFWWSRDSRSIAFCEVDERHVTEYQIAHSADPDPHAVETHRYPFAGADNAHVRLGVVAAAGGGDETVWMDLGIAPDDYLARVQWLPDGGLVAQTITRDQKTLDIARLDPETGGRTPLVRETSEIWVEPDDMFHPLDDGRFIRSSQRTGHRRLELRAGDGSLIRSLAEGDGRVTDLVGLDAESGTVFAIVVGDDPRESPLLAIPLDGSASRPLAAEPGVHEVVMDAAGERFVDVHSNTATPPSATLRDAADGHTIETLHIADDDRIADLALEPPELVEIESRDSTTLYAALYRPESDTPPPWPTVISVYGGPHVQLVTNSWALTANMRAQHLRRLGFAVLMLDNRGSRNRGLEFEGAVLGRFGDIEIRDQVDGAHWLVDSRIAEPDRIGIYGWSFGGFMTLTALSSAADLFRAGIAGAPVVEWEGYDTTYTERYLGTPDSNAAGYEASSVLTHVESLTAPLLVIHGMLDENVHYRHSVRLIEELNRLGKTIELLPLPNERHMPREPGARALIEDRVTEFLVRELLA